MGTKERWHYIILLVVRSFLIFCLAAGLPGSASLEVLLHYEWRRPSRFAASEEYEKGEYNIIYYLCELFLLFPLFDLIWLSLPSSPLPLISSHSPSLPAQHTEQRTLIIACVMAHFDTNNDLAKSTYSLSNIPRKGVSYIDWLSHWHYTADWLSYYGGTVKHPTLWPDERTWN